MPLPLPLLIAAIACEYIAAPVDIDPLDPCPCEPLAELDPFALRSEFVGEMSYPCVRLTASCALLKSISFSCSAVGHGDDIFLDELCDSGELSGFAGDDCDWLVDCYQIHKSGMTKLGLDQIFYAPARASADELVDPGHAQHLQRQPHTTLVSPLPHSPSLFFAVSFQKQQPQTTSARAHQRLQRLSAHDWARDERY